ncbi:large conductance mechanosensitive channel protein MscL [Rhodocaloribacter sp.]
MLKEFKEFAMKGNMVDMAVGIIIGAAFGAVVKSLVDDILMPIVAAVFGAPDFSNLFIILRNPPNVTGVDLETVAAVREAGGVALAYGSFINVIIAFLIVAFVLFLVVKAMNRMKREEEAAPAPAAPPEPSAEEKLLAEIRDLLKSQAG